MLIKIETYEDNRGTVGATLYACLATGKEDGCLVLGGRKTGDITFSSDKSVSRQHCTVRCVGLMPGMVKPRNEEEKKACSSSDQRMCLVYENTGKGGSFVATEDVATKNPNQVDDSDTDEETDDEGISQQSVRRQPNGSSEAAIPVDLPPVAAATREYFESKPVKLRKIDVGESHICKFDSGMTEIIQLGRFESTIKITHIPLRIMFSNMKSVEFEKTILPKLHTIGGIRVDDTGSPSHLVTEELNAGAKQIVAWSQQLPMVRIGFLQALLDRKSSADPMPDPTDFPIEKNSDKSINFWSKQPNRKLLGNFTLLSVEQGTFETLAIAAGVNLYRLYELAAADEEQMKIANEVLSKQSGNVCFTPKTRKRITKKLHSLGVPLVDLKKLAKSVTGQTSQLIDASGAVLTPSTRLQSTPSPAQAARLTEESQEQNMPEEETPPETETTPYETQCLLDPASQPLAADSDHPMPDQPEMIPEESIEAAQMDESSDQDIPQPKHKTTSRKSTRSSSHGSVEESGDKLQAIDKNGWFTAAPKGDNIRMQWRERFSKLNGDEDFDFETTVETETMEVLTSDQEVRTWRVPPGRKRNGVPDFRKFRKNAVADRDSAITIELRVVEPQENQDQQSFEEHERELAEEQRLADALFRGEGATGARKLLTADCDLAALSAWIGLCNLPGSGGASTKAVSGKAKVGGSVKWALVEFSVANALWARWADWFRQRGSILCHLSCFVVS
eukprot:scaffold2141_cov120-Cylindrotheca_fusiformis.AAC.3